MLQQISFSGLPVSLSLKEYRDLVSHTLNHITSRVYSEWVTMARNNLGYATSKQYEQSLELTELDYDKKAITLHGFLPNAIEEGLNPFDMKAGFSRSVRKKITKAGGWYLTVPFRFGAPNTIRFRSLPQNVYDYVRGKSQSYEKQKRFRVPVEIDGVKRNEYRHKSDIYEGIKQIRRFGGGSIYTGFRRVSSNSDIDSWLHTGITARKFLEGALGEVNIAEEAEYAATNYLT